MSSRFVEISPQDWPKLCDLYREHKKESSGYGFLKTIANWISKDPNLIKIMKIYALDGDWQNDGTFIFITLKEYRLHQLLLFEFKDYGVQEILIYLNTLDNDLERLLEALKCLNLRKTFRVNGVPARIMPALRKYVTYKKLERNDMKFVDTVWYHIEREKALNFDISTPKGFGLTKLDLSHAEYINHYWPYKRPGSLLYVKRLIKFNDNVGVYDATGNLIAWCLISPLGSLGFLTVLEDYKRHGLGTFLVRYMSHLIASKNDEVLASVVTSIVASRALFEKLGFSIIDEAYWFDLK